MNRVLLAAAALAVACGGGKAQKPDAASDQTPSWLSEGTGAIRGESGRRLQGVGVASGVGDPRARRRQADGAARDQLECISGRRRRSSSPARSPTSVYGRPFVSMEATSSHDVWLLDRDQWTDNLLHEEMLTTSRSRWRTGTAPAGMTW